MPSENPLFKGKWSIEKFRATVINDIWPEVMFFSLIATVVTVVSEKTDVKLSVSTQLLTVLGTVLGLVISFRTSTAYERYQEGRKLWTNITITSRNLAQMIWIHVPSERPAKPDQPQTTLVQNIIEKKTMINLVQGFSVALKHYLRAEPGIYYRDLYPLVCVLPRYVNKTPRHDFEDLLPLWHASEHDDHDHHTHHEAPANRNPRDLNNEIHRISSLPTPEHHYTDSQTEVSESGTSKSWFSSNKTHKSKKSHWDPESALGNIPASRPLKPARSPPEASVYNYIPLLRLFKWIYRRISAAKGVACKPCSSKKRHSIPQESNVPLEITLQLSTYSSWLMRSGLLQPAIATSITAQIIMMQDTLSNLDRIANTPLPFAYQAHLRMSLWIYLFFLPFQIWSSFHWVTIPGTAFASFLLLGFLEIGQEIENPFNYDENDLDLDSFCLAIQRELHEITAHTAPEPDQFVFSGWNQPFAPADRRTAEQLCEGGAMSYITPEKAEKHTHHSDMDDPCLTKESLRLTMLRNWRNVDEITRERH